MASAEAVVSAEIRPIWTFDAYLFDEARWILSADSRPIEIEAKPLEILRLLLRAAGEVVTREELLDAVWPDVTVTEASLATAVSKLRKAIGDQGRIVVTVPRIGYRLGVPAVISRSTRTRETLPYSPGMQVPDRPNWRFGERLGLSSSSEVWRIDQSRTGEQRVLKYASDAGRLHMLKRELALSRLLRRAFGERPDFVPVLEWNFEHAPFFIESGYGGPDLANWAEARGGIARLPLAARIELLAGVAATVAAAHGLAVLHNDLKPSNILIAETPDGAISARVVDFGSAALTDPDRIDALGITRSGFDLEAARSPSSSGTYLWMAPELLTGAAASTASDIFALGVILYQLIVGDLRRPLAPGWEKDIADPLLREDIGAAAAGDPALRLESAADLARRLRTLDMRRAERAAAEATAERVRIAEARLQRLRTRRPWLITIAALLIAGLITSSMLFLSAERARNEAQRQAAIATRVNAFLGTDLLARSSPFRSGQPDETLVGAVKQAATLIDRRFAGEPAVAARLHQTVATALDKRSDWAGARTEYALAARAWREAEGPDSPNALIIQLQWAMMDARSAEGGSLARAKAKFAELQGPASALGPTHPEVGVWLASAKGMIGLIDNDLATAKAGFGEAVRIADTLPDFDESMRLTARQRIAFINIRTGDGAKAERMFRDLEHGFAAIEGPDGPDTLMVGMNLAQALMIQGRHADAVAQANLVYPRLVARLGTDHEMVLQLLTTRAQSEGSLGHWDDSIRDDLQVHAIAVRKQGPKSFFAVATLTDAATAQCRAGQLEAGLRSAVEANQSAQAAFGKAALTDGTAYTLAECEIAAGRYAGAAHHLEGIDRAAVTQLAGDPHWGANVDLALARIALAEGRRADARHSLDAARPAFINGSVDPYQAKLWHKLDQEVGRPRENRSS
jgi:DNA-binding winged helix-turn-helix (wHTH) protein/serine/threonine protein kinase